MKELKFKTNINCSSCVANITPALNHAPGIEAWQVDTTTSQKVLTVSTENLKEDEVIKLVLEAGYKAESL